MIISSSIHVTANGMISFFFMVAILYFWWYAGNQELS